MKMRYCCGGVILRVDLIGNLVYFFLCKWDWIIIDGYKLQNCLCV